MALTLRANGSSAPNIVQASWWNDYYNLLTGAMTDQPVTLSYAPGGAGSTPTLLLKTNGNAPLLQGYNGATQEFSFDAVGNLTLTGSAKAGSVFDNNNRVAIQGSHSAGQPIVSYGTGVPGSLGANEVYFQVA